MFDNLFSFREGRKEIRIPNRVRKIIKKLKSIYTVRFLTIHSVKLSHSKQGLYMDLVLTNYCKQSFFYVDRGFEITLPF